MVVVYLCVFWGKGVENELLCTHCNRGKIVVRKRTCAYKGEGKDQKPELSFVRVSPKTSRSINPFLFNAFLIILRGIEGQHKIG